ncbi:hypothetical protein ACSSZE_17310 [Acidithiobacillus caldus]
MALAVRSVPVGKRTDPLPKKATENSGGGVHLPKMHINLQEFMRNRRAGNLMTARETIGRMERLERMRRTVTDPDKLKKIDKHLEKQAKRLEYHTKAAFDNKGMDFMMRGGVDPKMMSDTLKKMEAWAQKHREENLQSGGLSGLWEKMKETFSRVRSALSGSSQSQSSQQSRGMSMG